VALTLRAEYALHSAYVPERPARSASLWREQLERRKAVANIESTEVKSPSGRNVPTFCYPTVTNSM
jgi:hypothetical protein